MATPPMTRQSVENAEPLGFDPPEAPAPPVSTKVRIEMVIKAQRDGWPIDIHLAIPIDKLPDALARLRAAGLEPATARQTPPASPGRTPLPDPLYRPDGQACCPWHHTALREGQYGYYCPSRAEGEQANAKGYCRFSTKEV